MKKIKKKLKKNPGFSLIEIIVAMSIFVTATLIVTAYIIQGWNVNRFAIEQSDAIDHAKKGIVAMSREIREASPGANGDFTVIEGLNQSFTFYSDIDLDEAPEKVKYYLDGTNLKKQYAEATSSPPVYGAYGTAEIISQYIRNGADPIFYYYGGGSLATSSPFITPADPHEIKLVMLRLKVNINPSVAPEEYILENYIQIRNLKDNL